MARDFPTARVSLWVPPAPAGAEGCGLSWLCGQYKPTCTDTRSEGLKMGLSGGARQLAGGRQET